MTDEFDQVETVKMVNSDVTSGLPVFTDSGRKLWVRCLMQVLWPAFIGAAITVGIIFSMIDPMQIEWVHAHLNDSREATYTVSFILFWILYTLACSMTWILVVTESPTARIGAKRRS